MKLIIENKVTRKEAVQFKNGNFDEMEKFVGGDAEFRNGEMIIATLEGALHVSENDYVIKGLNGEFYPCKPDIFKKSYNVINGEP